MTGQLHRGHSAAVPGPAVGLWSSEDLLRWLATSTAGLSVWAVGCYLASGQAHYSSQIGPADLAIAGTVLYGLGNVFWILRGMRALNSRRRDVLEGPVRRAKRRPAVTRRDPDTSIRSSEPGAGLLIAGEGTRFFHRHGCPLVSGRNWPARPRERLEGAGLIPCGVCTP